MPPTTRKRAAPAAAPGLRAELAKRMKLVAPGPPPARGKADNTRQWSTYRGYEARLRVWVAHLAPRTVEDEPTLGDERFFEHWVRQPSWTRDRVRVVLERLKATRVHKRYVQLVEQWERHVRDQLPGLVDAMRQTPTPGAPPGPANDPYTAQRVTREAVETALRAYRARWGWGRGRGRACPLARDEAYAFALQRDGAVAGVRLLLLVHLGRLDPDDAIALTEALARDRADFERAQTPEDVTFAHWRALVARTGQPLRALRAWEPQRIAEAIEDSSHHARGPLWACARAVLDPALAMDVARCLGRRVTGVGPADLLEGPNPTGWRAAFVAALRAHHTQRAEGFSSRPEERATRTLDEDARLLAFVERQGHPLREFVERADPEQAQELILAWGRQGTRRAASVRLERYAHQAQYRVGHALNTFRRLLQAPATRRALEGTTTASLVAQIPFQRAAPGTEPDPARRRTLDPDEIRALRRAAAGDPKMTLILTILREVGLRVGALQHMKYSVLLEPDHTARDKCRVLEKGRKWRHFVTSNRLRADAEAWSRYLRGELGLDPAHDPDAFFLFGRDGREPLQNLSGALRCLARAAGVSEVEVTAHTFRYTIVGELLEAGNSIADVSKFLGHASTNVTMRHYWVSTADQIHRQIRDPFAEPTEGKEGARETIDRCLRQIHAYNVAIARFTDEVDPEAGERLQDRLFAAMPGLAEALEVLAIE